MTRRFRMPHLGTMPLAALLLTGTALPAFAVDGDDFATKLNAAYAVQGGEIRFSEIETDGSTVVLKDTTLTSPGQPEFKAGDIRFEGVSETGGGYEVETVLVPDLEHTEDDVTVTLTDMRLEGLAVPAEPNLDSLDGFLIYERFSTGPMTVTYKGTEAFRMASMEATADRMADDRGFDVTLTGEGLKFDTAAIDDAEARQTMVDLGYQTLTGNVYAEGSWTIDTGRLHMPEYALTIDDVGRLDIAFDVSGYTLEFMHAMQAAQEAAASNPDNQAAQQAMGMAMLGMMQQLTFASAEISFEDASLTQRLLDYYGEKQGVSGEQMAQAAKALVPLMVGRIGIPALEQQIVAAANTFLEDPQNLTISARPAEPVPFAQIIGAGMTAPKSLVDTLDVQVKANQ